MTAAGDAVDALTASVDYLRVTTGRPPADREWIDCAVLTSDADALAELVRSSKEGRGTSRDDVAMSLFVQGYAFRIASLAVGAWVLADIGVDVAPGAMAIALGRHRPNAVHLHHLAAVRDDADVETLHETLVQGHLAPMVGTAHRACRVGEALLWGNVGASIASSFGMLMGPLEARRADIRDRVEAFFASARPELARSGRVARVGAVWAWERSACCLWYTTDSGFRCEDCSLWTDDERQERYDRVLADEATP